MRETATESRNERGDLGRMGNIKKVQNHEYYVSEESRGRWTWKSTNGETKTEIE